MLNGQNTPDRPPYQYQKQILKNSTRLAENLKKNGFRLVSGGTDNHLMLVDLRNKNLTGKVAEKVLDEVGITVNKNTIPFETESPFITSGIRVGTPAVTTRGMKESEMDVIGELISECLSNVGSETTLKSVSKKVKELTRKFTLYPEL